MLYQLIKVKNTIIAKLPAGQPTIMFLNLLLDDNDLCNNIENLLGIGFFDSSDITIEVEKKEE